MNATGIELDQEDAKLVTLARGARGRIGAAEGAAIRDEMGRTYAGATVATEHLALSALQLAVASAIAAGARGAEAAVIVLEPPHDATPSGASERVSGIDALRELGGPGIPIYLCQPDGAVTSVVRT